MMNKVKHCTENKACHKYCSNKQPLFSVCAQTLWAVFDVWRVRIITEHKQNCWWVVPSMHCCILFCIKENTQTQTGSHTYTEYSPVSKVTGYSMDDHHSITESDCSERLTIYIHLVSWSRMNGVLSPGPLQCSTADA